jgi:hypothetical protein
MYFQNKKQSIGAASWGFLTSHARVLLCIAHDPHGCRYQIEAHLPLPEPGTRVPAISEALALLLGNTDGHDGAAGPCRRGPGARHSTPGVFAVGDVRHGSVKRVASAVGDGSIAIRLAHDYLA